MRQEQRLKHLVLSVKHRRGQELWPLSPGREVLTRERSSRPHERGPHPACSLDTLEHASRAAAGVLACAERFGVTQARHQSEMLGLLSLTVSSRCDVCVRICCREDLRCVRTFLGGDLFRLPRPPDDAAKINSEQPGIINGRSDCADDSFEDLERSQRAPSYDLKHVDELSPPLMIGIKRSCLCR